MLKKENFLPFAPPEIGPEEIEAVVEALRSGWITTGQRADEFERSFASFVSAPGSLAVQSCTSALLVSLAAMGIKPGQKVITSTMTFCSTVHVIEQIGAVPVLVDISPDTLNLDPSEVEVALQRNPDVFAVIPVHYAGHPCDMGAILDLARWHDVAVIEDAAHALGACVDDRPIGAIEPDSIPRAACFSFYATKNLTTGEGGMVTGLQEFIDEARLWSLHGMSRDAWRRYDRTGSWQYEVIRPGFKCNMTDIQAAIGLQQLRKFSGFQERRAAIATEYLSGLAGIRAVRVPVVRPGNKHAWHLFPIRLQLDQLRISRDDFILEMINRGVGVSVHFMPVHAQPYYMSRYGYTFESLPIAWHAFEELVSLPIYPAMTSHDVGYVLECVHDIVDKHHR